MKIIGQLNLVNSINSLISSGSFPRVSTILGRYGYGKTHIAKYIADKLSITDIVEVSSIDEVRDIILNAPNLSHDTMVLVSNFESMNFRAKETLLKLCEDVPKFIYIVIEITNISLYEDRFLNRSQLFELEPYTKEDLQNILIEIKSDISNEEIDKMLSTFGAPKDFEQVLECGIDNVIGYISKVIDNVSLAQPFNSMKILDMLSTKADDKKMNFNLFFRALSNLAFRKYYKSRDKKYLNLFNCSNIVLDEISECPRINKRALFDKFILDLQEANYGQ